MGWPQPGRCVAILGTDGTPTPRGEPGVLAVNRSDPGLMLGYWQDDARTVKAHAEDGLSIIAAWIVPASDLDADTLQTHCAAHLAAYKIPRAFHEVDALPHTANGKLQRRALRL